MYEQAKWSILTEEVECTEEEAYTFAALQVRSAADAKPTRLTLFTVLQQPTVMGLVLSSDLIHRVYRFQYNVREM